MSLWCPPLFSGFVCAYHPAVPGSNRKYAIYTFVVKFNTTFVIVLRKRTKISEKRPDYNIFHKSLLVGQILECIWTLIPALILIQVTCATFKFVLDIILTPIWRKFFLLFVLVDQVLRFARSKSRWTTTTYSSSPATTGTSCLRKFDLSSFTMEKGLASYIPTYLDALLMTFMYIDVGVKKLPKCFQKLPKKYPQQFVHYLIFFKTAQKSKIFLGYFWEQICCQELLKIAQSGHTVCHRYDFVLTANRKSDIYWIRFGGLLDCAKVRVHTAAILGPRL